MTRNEQKIIRPVGNSGLKQLPALDYRRIISTSNEHFTNRANPFPIFGNGSSSQNVSGYAKRQGISFQIKFQRQNIIKLYTDNLDFQIKISIDN